jgi:hypothetical protein
LRINEEEDVIVRCIEPSGESGSNRMTGKVTLSFGRLIEEYTGVTASGPAETIKKGLYFGRNRPVLLMFKNYGLQVLLYIEYW